MWKSTKRIAAGNLTFDALKLQEITAFADKSTLLSKQSQKGWRSSATRFRHRKLIFHEMISLFRSLLKKSVKALCRLNLFSVFITKVEVNWTNSASITQKSGEGVVIMREQRPMEISYCQFHKNLGSESFPLRPLHRFYSFVIGLFSLPVPRDNKEWQPRDICQSGVRAQKRLDDTRSNFRKDFFCALRICMSAIVYHLVWILLGPDNDDMDLLFISGRQLLQSFCFGAWFCFALLGKLPSAWINRPIFAAIQFNWSRVRCF